MQKIGDVLGKSMGSNVCTRGDSGEWFGLPIKCNEGPLASRRVWHPPETHIASSLDS